MGTATNAATVTVNGQITYRHNDYYRAQLGVDNSSGPVFQSVSNLAVLTVDTNVISTNIVGTVFLPQTPEAFTYDADGNLTSDGRWTYLWDGENRLIAMTNNANVPDGAKMTLSFVYDYLGRRIRKTVSGYNSATSSYQAALQNTFVYDGWNLQAELNATNKALVRSYVWGPDLSGTGQGAGGVGGLLWTFQPQAGNARAFLCFDGNGNVTTLVYSPDATIVGQYEYDAFGEVIRATGPLAKTNPFRSSTKYQDDETDLLYYGYRYYNPSTGRWLSRDPAGEDSGDINLYSFVSNDPLAHTDELGLMKQQNIIDGVKRLDAAIRSQPCCCKSKVISKVYETITGTASGTGVSGHATVEVQGCVEDSIAFYWWTCYDAAAERNPFWHKDWKDYGWSLTYGKVPATDSYFSKSYEPGFWSGLLGTFDPYHVAMDSMVTYTYCGPDGFRHATYRASNELIFTWNKKTKSWTAP
jgi:RHS repeat-associated protein